MQLAGTKGYIPTVTKKLIPAQLDDILIEVVDERVGKVGNELEITEVKYPFQPSKLANGATKLRVIGVFTTISWFVKIGAKTGGGGDTKIVKVAVAKS